MNSLLNLLLFVSFSIGCSSDEQKHLSNDITKLHYQKDVKSLNLEFPVKPKVSSEILPIRGKQVNLTTYLATTDSGIYLLFELELGELKDQVTQDASGFFNGILSYLINDIGAQVGRLSDFTYEGFKGCDFNIISPNKDENRTAKGKTLLVEDRAYIWFGISNTSNSSQNVDQFINSHSFE